MLKSNNNRLRPRWKNYALPILILFLISTHLYAVNYKGFNFVNDKTESVIPFQLIDNLIVVPVKINDELEVNLVLDTGGRSVILFGNHFTKKLDVLDTEIKLNGYGRNRNKTALLSLENEVLLGDALGKGISILVTNGRYFFPFNGKVKIHGIIGYQVFSRFVVSIDYLNSKIVLSEPQSYIPPVDYTELDLTLKDTKPYVKLRYQTFKNEVVNGYFHIDTGSSRDVLLFLKSNMDIGNGKFVSAEVGRGINGAISGHKPVRNPMKIEEFNTAAEYFVVKREFSRKEIQDAEGSIGSGLLKNYIVVLDYANQRFYFKSNA